MAILAAMQSAATRLMGQRPTVFFGASDKFAMEMVDLVNEVAADVHKSHDWQAVTKIASVIGDGVTGEFALPDDYDRMLVVADLQDANNWCWGYRSMPNINDFIYYEDHGFQPFPGGWIIYGGKLRFSPAPGADDTAKYPYISKNYAKDGATLAEKAAFSNDNDTFLLPERLLTLGLVWRWRENKKLDFTGDQEAFMKAIDEYAAKDSGSRVIRRNARHVFSGVRVAWPWALG